MFETQPQTNGIWYILCNVSIKGSGSKFYCFSIQPVKHFLFILQTYRCHVIVLFIAFSSIIMQLSTAITHILSQTSFISGFFKLEDVQEKVAKVLENLLQLLKAGQNQYP